MGSLPDAAYFFRVFLDNRRPAASLLDGGLVFFPTYVYTILPIAFLIYGSMQNSIPSKILTGGLFILTAAALLFEYIKRPQDRIAWRGFFGALVALYMLSSGFVYSQYLLTVPLVLNLLRTVVLAVQKAHAVGEGGNRSFLMRHAVPVRRKHPVLAQ